ncbi:MAG: ComF family protein [Dermatophilaceae bacterium]
MPTSSDAARLLLGAAVGLVLPGQCAGCGAPGAPLCGRCQAAVGRAVAPGLVPRSAGAVPCWAGAVLEGPLRRLVSVHKDGGRRDVRPILAAPLAMAVLLALTRDPISRRMLAGGEPVRVVPVPAARRARYRRGDDPVSDLARAALRLAWREPGVDLAAVLRHTRQVADQAGLGRSGRAANLAGALAVSAPSRPVVSGAVCLVVDDVVTTGATLAEAARALRAAGARHVVAAAVAATPRRGPGLVGSGRQDYGQPMSLRFREVVPSFSRPR